MAVLSIRDERTGQLWWVWPDPESIPAAICSSCGRPKRPPGSGTRRFEVVTDLDQMVREILEDTFALFSLSWFRKSVARRISGRAASLGRAENHRAFRWRHNGDRRRGHRSGRIGLEAVLSEAVPGILARAWPAWVVQPNNETRCSHGTGAGQWRGTGAPDRA